jgi:hypothetical protein
MVLLIFIGVNICGLAELKLSLTFEFVIFYIPKDLSYYLYIS